MLTALSTLGTARGTIVGMHGLRREYRLEASEGNSRGGG